MGIPVEGIVWLLYFLCMFGAVGSTAMAVAIEYYFIDGNEAKWRGLTTMFQFGGYIVAALLFILIIT